MSDFDLLICGGTVVDGTGAPQYRADLGIVADRIHSIGDLSGSTASRTLDATGCVVAPGVVDHHTHYDAQIFRDPTCADGGRNGVTSVVMTNCGFGFAPCRPPDRDRYMVMMENVEQIPVAVQRASLPWDWESFPEFLDSLRRTDKAVNALVYVPLNALMIYVMGIEPSKTRPATCEEIAEMKRLLGEAMDAGAIGLSLSCLGENNLHLDFDGSPMPTDVMSIDQAIEIAMVLNERDQGVIQCLSGVAGVMSSVVASERIAEATGRPLFHNVVATSDAGPVHKPGLAWLDSMTSKGLDMWSASFCSRNWAELAVDTSTVFDGDEAFRELSYAKSNEERLALLSDEGYRQRLRNAYQPEKFVATGGVIETFSVSSAGTSEELAELEGRNMGQVAAERGVLPVDLYADIVAGSNCEVIFNTGFVVSTDPGVVKEVFLHNRVLPGGSDGGAHLKSFSGGHWATDMLVHLVREHGVVSLEQAHHKFSGLPMELFGIEGRGTLVEGNFADVLIYRLDELFSNVEAFEKAYDLPDGDWRKQAHAGGYKFILTNGSVTFEAGAATGTSPGAVLSPST